MKQVQASDVDALLRVLQFLTKKQRSHFLQTINKEQMRILEVAFYNLATNPTGLSKAQLRALSQHKRKIETIASKGFKHADKKKILKQKGGFLGAVLPILGTLVSSFLT